jgi:hypothetical protein
MPFISDQALRRIAERDYGSLVSMLKQREWKAALILAGCVIEAALADALAQASPTSREDAAKRTAAKAVAAGRGWGTRFEPANTELWKFHQMIEICGPAPDGLDLLGTRTVEAAHAVRDFRNYVHPRLEASTLDKEPLRESDASIADALVKLVLDDLAQP